ncbi:MAG: glycosyltransferase family 9 protein [Chlorobiaceae bacterium]
MSSIGDIILTTPVIRYLNTAFPEARIDYCTNTSFSTLLLSNPRISFLYTPEHPPKNNYDLVVDLQNNIRSRAIVSALNANRIVRYRKQNWKKWLLVQFKINSYSSLRNVVDRYQDSLKGLNVLSDFQGCDIYPSSEDREYASPFFKNDRKTLAVCFGAKHFTKRYPPKQFAALLSLVLKEQSLQVLLLGGKEDAPQASEIMKTLPEVYQFMVLNLAGSCSLMQTAALLERCHAVLCNDTGLMHIASAFGKKLFVLFGSSSEAFGFFPFNTPYDLFEVVGLPCRPCSHIGRDQCPKGHFRCMNDQPKSFIASKILDYFNQQLT